MVNRGGYDKKARDGVGVETEGLQACSLPVWGRRSWLKMAAGLGCSWALPGCDSASPARNRPWDIPVVSAINVSGLGYRMAALPSGDQAAEDRAGSFSSLWQQSTPTRGHAVVVDPRGEDLILVARRPGNTIWIRSLSNLGTGQSPSPQSASRSDLASDSWGGGSWRSQSADPGRHYFGHGSFGADGRLLYLSENVYKEYDAGSTVAIPALESVVGVYDRDLGYQKIGELAAFGIGSHELAVAPQQNHLVVAHGGYYTHPDLPRQILNAGEEKPALVYLDPENGDLLEKVAPFNPHMSVRHFDIANDGQVVVGLQYGGDVGAKVPLVMSHRRGGAIEYWEIPESVRSGLRQYTASVAIDPQSGRVAVSAPKGGCILFFEPDGRFIYRHPLPDAAGLDVCAQGFVASSGTGRLELIDAQTLKLRSSVEFEGVQWDNHLSVWRGGLLKRG